MKCHVVVRRGVKVVIFFNGDFKIILSMTALKCMFDKSQYLEMIAEQFIHILYLNT